MDDLKEKFELAKQKNETFILGPEDAELGIDNENKEIKTIDDLVMVHVTSYLPVGAVKTPRSTNKHSDYDAKYIINGKEYVFNMTSSSYRNTAHFCLNGAPENHEYRTVEKNKYAVLLPLATNKDKIIAGTECDLFSDGNVPIKEDGYILCIEEEIENVKKANPTATVIGCKGDSVDPYINVFLSRVLGYKYKEPTEKSRSWDHGRSEDRDMAEKIIADNGWEYTIHNGSKWSDSEAREQCLEQLIQLINNLKSNKVLYDKESMPDVFEIIAQCIDQSIMLSGYGFLNEFNKEESFKYIAERILKETGIDLERKLDRDDIKTTGIDGKKMLYSTLIVEQLRIQALLDKEKHNGLSEREKIELDYNQNVGDFYEFESAKELNWGPKRQICEKLIFQGVINSSDNNVTDTQVRECNNAIDALNKIDSLKNKELKDLTIDELDSVLAFINLKFKTISPKIRLNAVINVGYHESEKFILDTPPTVPAYKTIFLAPYTGFEFNEGLSAKGISKEEYQKQINDKLRNAQSEDELLEYQKSIFELPNSHLKMQSPLVLRTDFDASNCQTVADLIETVTNYGKCFRDFYNGYDIKFDEYGNIEDTMDSEINKTR